MGYLKKITYREMPIVISEIISDRFNVMGIPLALRGGSGINHDEGTQAAAQTLKLCATGTTADVLNR